MKPRGKTFEAKHGAVRASGKFGFWLLGLIMIFVNSAPSEAQPFVYVTNNGSNDVSVIDAATNTLVGTPIPLGGAPYGVGMTPSPGNCPLSSNFICAYVTDSTGNYSIIETVSNTIVGGGGGLTNPHGVAVTPIGTCPVASNSTCLFIANYGTNFVSVFDTGTGSLIGNVVVTSIGSPGLERIAFSPAGSCQLPGVSDCAYVTNYGSPLGIVSVVDVATLTLVGQIRTQIGPLGIDITPTGAEAYVAQDAFNDVSVVNLVTDLVTSLVVVGNSPWGVAITPDPIGRPCPFAPFCAYITNGGSNSMSVIAGVTVVGGTTLGGVRPRYLAITPGTAAPCPFSSPPSSSCAYIADSASASVDVVDLQTNNLVTTIPLLGTGPTDVAVTPF